MIVDATYRRSEEREAIAAVGAHVGVPFLGLWLEAPIELLMRRVTDRRGDASDATAATVAAQSKQSIGILTWGRLDASQKLDALTTRTLDLAQR